jgi:hypothetical protein
MQFGLLNGKREVIGLYPEFTLQKRKFTPTEGEKNCKLPQEETQQMNNTHHHQNSVANSNDHQHRSNSIIYKTWPKKKVACLSITQKNDRFLRHEKAGFKSDFPS